jgi:two-component sensor histidine kinase
MSFISSVISVILALYAIRFSKRTEERLKNNFVHIRSMMDMQNEKTEDLLASIEKEAENIRSSVHGTRLELLDSIENIHRIREEILGSMQSLEDRCIMKDDEKEE